MIFTAHQVEQIARAGGSLVLDASAWTFNQLREIITAASQGGGSITIKNLSGLTAAQLGQLAALAPGATTFDLTS